MKIAALILTAGVFLVIGDATQGLVSSIPFGVAAALLVFTGMAIADHCTTEETP